MKVSTEQLENLLAFAKVDVQMQTSGRYKRQAEEQVSILTELLSLRNAQSEAVARLVDETGSESVEEMQNMALIGHSLMSSIAAIQYEGSEWANWAPADDPAEIVTDLFNALHEALTHPAPPLAVTDERIERMARALHDEWNGVGAWSSLTDRDRRRWEFMARTALTAALEAKQ